MRRNKLAMEGWMMEGWIEEDQARSSDNAGRAFQCR
jgi:hypothetical protein